MSQQELVRQFGKSGSYYYNIVRGVDDRPVVPSRERKSLGAENTFFTDYTEPEDLKAQLLKIEDEVWRRLQRSQTYGRTLTLK